MMRDLLRGMRLWRKYRNAAQSVRSPDTADETELLALMSAYRQQAEQQNNSANTDEHEWAMNFR